MVCEVCLCPRQRHENKDFVPRVREGEGSHRLPKQGLDGAPQICGRGGNVRGRGAAAWTACPEQSRRGPVQTKNGPRFRRGPSCLGSLVLRELFWRPTAGEPLARLRASGGGLRLLRAARRTVNWKPQHGVMRCPGPPNCFPSTAGVRCWCEPAPVWYLDPYQPFRREHCPARRSACGRRESDVR